MTYLKLLLTACALLIALVPVKAGSNEGVGVEKLDVTDPVAQRPMDAVAFFPSSLPTGETSIGPYQVAASKLGKIGESRYPVIVISHGSAGSMWSHHDLASVLARKGNIVISVTHPGDNFRDTSQVGAVSSIYGRPAQITAVLNAALKSEMLAPHVDSNRIGFIGFSAGGTTGLILAGAKPTFSRLESYCTQRPDDRHVCEAQGKIRNDRPELAPSLDPRIRSLVLLAPFSVIFPPEDLKRISVPALIFVGSEDKELSPSDNAIALAHELASKTALEVISNAGHFTFLAPCSSQLTQSAPELCIDNPKINRFALHQKINAEIAGFFNRTLGTL
ncbi:MULTISPECIES: dienelactone hydrolase [unclassified Ochrobactrum]|uniref:alpha/beta hydrolase family protein n=1 Tax=unclassified Ochrobactrum TaxID=239106 RepID=UPI0013B389E4|nr:dienelactone hydrolase [Ochrobactrum sp. 3-3]MBQ0709202.1 dienelactone hydrolase [Ochrobactrum sp. AP1BH01-1]